MKPTPTAAPATQGLPLRRPQLLLLFATVLCAGAAPTQAQTTKAPTDKPMLLRDPAAAQPAQRAAPAPPPPPVPAVKASVNLGQELSGGHGHYGDIFVSGSGLDLMNNLRMTPASSLRISLKTPHAAAFPQGSLNLVLTGQPQGVVGNLTMTALADPARKVVCPVQRVPTFRCVLTLPLGAPGVQQHVGVSTAANLSLWTISLE